MNILEKSGSVQCCARPQASGFTLVEVMVAVAIVAVLATVALPSYRQYVRRQALSEGVSALTELQVRMESYYQNTGAYGLSTGTACGIALGNPSRFTLACTTAAGTDPAATPAQSYTATATGTGNVSDVVYGLTSQGVKTTTTNGVTANCWQVSGREC